MSCYQGTFPNVSLSVTDITLFDNESAFRLPFSATLILFVVVSPPGCIFFTSFSSAHCCFSLKIWIRKKERSHDTVGMQWPLEISSTNASIVVPFNSASHNLIPDKGRMQPDSLLRCRKDGFWPSKLLAGCLIKLYLHNSRVFLARSSELGILPSAFSKDPRTTWSDMSQQLRRFFALIL